MNNLNFRAWHKELKEMEQVLLMCFVNQYVSVLPVRNLEGGSQEQWNFKDIILMQSTGLKDSKGVEIFEGDIIDWNLFDNNPFIIKYYSSRHTWFADDIFNDEEGEFLEDLKSEDICILGNIYEQPELLGGGE